tara:strand:+ start:464 stop:826 length:363 start_codon:yes stop_codon:yes gene_type:complete
VDAKQIGNGRHVKCTRCNHTWYYESNDFDIRELETQKELQSSQAKEYKTNPQSNLPVVYENKTNIPLPFLLLVVVAISVLGYMIIESIEFDSEALKQCMNQSIDKIIIWLKDFIETLLET